MTDHLITGTINGVEYKLGLLGNVHLIITVTTNGVIYESEPSDILYSKRNEIYSLFESRFEYNDKIESYEKNIKEFETQLLDTTNKIKNQIKDVQDKITLEKQNYIRNLNEIGIRKLFNLTTSLSLVNNVNKTILNKLNEHID